MSSTTVSPVTTINPFQNVLCTPPVSMDLPLPAPCVALMGNAAAGKSAVLNSLINNNNNDNNCNSTVNNNNNSNEPALFKLNDIVYNDVRPKSIAQLIQLKNASVRPDDMPISDSSIGNPPTFELPPPAGHTEHEKEIHIQQKAEAEMATHEDYTYCKALHTARAQLVYNLHLQLQAMREERKRTHSYLRKIQHLRRKRAAMAAAKGSFKTKKTNGLFKNQGEGKTQKTKDTTTATTTLSEELSSLYLSSSSCNSIIVDPATGTTRDRRGEDCGHKKWQQHHDDDHWLNSTSPLSAGEDGVVDVVNDVVTVTAADHNSNNNNYNNNNFN